MTDEGRKPVRWLLKARLMPSIYFDLMLKGHEWLARPARVEQAGVTLGS